MVQDLGHVLTDVIGSGSRPSADVEQFRLADGDSVLLCTNGLTDVVDDDRIAETLALPRRPSEQCTLLIDLVKERGGEDNATLVLAQYRFPAAPRAAG
jgi:protein phosphatase